MKKVKFKKPSNLFLIAVGVVLMGFSALGAVLYTESLRVNRQANERNQKITKEQKDLEAALAKRMEKIKSEKRAKEAEEKRQLDEEKVDSNNTHVSIQQNTPAQKSANNSLPPKHQPTSAVLPVAATYVHRPNGSLICQGNHDTMTIRTFIQVVGASGTISWKVISSKRGVVYSSSFSSADSATSPQGSMRSHNVSTLITGVMTEERFMIEASGAGGTTKSDWIINNFNSFDIDQCYV